MTIPCKHWRACGIVNGGCCSIGAYDTPSYGVCLSSCTKYEGPPRLAIGSMYGRSFVVPSHHEPRHAQILASDSPSPPLYLGDRIGALIGQLTHRKPCAGCKKVEAGLNLVDKWGRKLVAHAH